MKTSSTLAVLLTTLLAQSAQAAPPAAPFETDADPTPRNRIDDLVLSRLQQLDIAPARLCSDGVFLRRVYLDVTGTLPTADEARRFLGDTAADKRVRLIDDLLERDEYVEYWTMKWCDLLRVKS